MQCRDAHFYLRLRRDAGDELGTEVVADLDRHLAGCTACASDSRAAVSFDRTVAAAMRAVPVPSALRDKLLTIASVHRGGIIRRKAYQIAALAASVFLTAGLAFGLFSASRPTIDANDMVFQADELLQNPDGKIKQWLAAQKFPEQLPEPFDPQLLYSLGSEKVKGKDVPVIVFRHPTDVRGFARVYIFRDDGTYNLRELQDAQASLTMARVISDPARFRGVKYVIVHTVHPGANPHDNLLRPFLRTGTDSAQS